MMKLKYGKRVQSSRNAYPVCLFLIGMLLSGLFGCSKTEEYVVAVEENAVIEAETDASDESANQESTGDAMVNINEQNSAQNAENNQELAQQTESAMIYVDVCGAVQYPGVYRLESGARVFEALELAGGLKTEACVQAVNQAEFLSDGQKLYIPTQEEWDAGLIQDPLQSGTNTQTVSEKADDGRVNINTADVTKLCELPGIGEVRAQAIIKYREEQGNFESVEELQNVSGIKSGTYEKIKELIKVQ